MSRSNIDLAKIFAEVTGREMESRDLQELRRLLDPAPSGLRDSPAFLYSLVVAYHQQQLLRQTVATASATVLDSVPRLTEIAVSRIVDSSIKRIQKSSPLVGVATYRALASLTAAALAGVIFTGATFAGAIAAGWIPPKWIPASDKMKIEFAEVVESHLPGPRVDWVLTDGKADPRLVALVSELAEREKGSGPVTQLADLRACRSPGTRRYRVHGKQMCRFEVRRP